MSKKRRNGNRNVNVNQEVNTEEEVDDVLMDEFEDENESENLPEVVHESFMVKTGRWLMAKGYEAEAKKAKIKEEHPVATKVAKGAAIVGAIGAGFGVAYSIIKGNEDDENYDDYEEFIDVTATEVGEDINDSEN